VRDQTCDKHGACEGEYVVTLTSARKKRLLRLESGNGPIVTCQDATVTEYFDRFTAPNGDEWFSVTTVVDDPKYLNQTFVTSTHFKKEPDGSKWSPSPCRVSS